ncbi:hypothetical protein [Variovorax sp. UC122_21]|uniref:hypothetical protein n=1 Tax=Variovorax TaxID=34072 RepID=UPI0019326EBD|nr:hypothetical protein INQ48_35375 [Variovorax paradoxus]
MNAIPINGATSATRHQSARLYWFLPPLAAALYPLSLVGFHGSVARFMAGGNAAHWLGAAVCLCLAFFVPMLALWVFAKLMRQPGPTRAELLARRVALFSVTAPPLFVLVGVGTFVAGLPKVDFWILAIFWCALAVAIGLADPNAPADPPKPLIKPVWRVLHGTVALLFIAGFLALHFSNHLLALISVDMHHAVIEVLRKWYRTPLGEPLLLAAAAYLVCSGLAMAWRWSERSSDGFRAFQVATGVYLSVAVTSHLQAVFWLARVHMKIPTDWGFAIGAPAGLIVDPWNIRLLPYYALAVAAVTAHAFAGARIVLLGHGVSRRRTDALVIWGTAFGLLLMTLITLAMTGMRLNFSGR